VEHTAETMLEVGAILLAAAGPGWLVALSIAASSIAVRVIRRPLPAGLAALPG
jgi:hypothetical protein